MAGEPWSALLADSGASWTNWSWFAGRPVAGQWALDIVQIGRFGRDRFQAKSVAIEAENAFGWPALLAGAAEPDVLASGTVRIPFASLRDQIDAKGNMALADVPGLFERLDVPQLRELWPTGEVIVRP